MSEENNPQNAQTQEQKEQNKEYNFRQLESKFQKQLAEERAKREEAERQAQDAINRANQKDIDEDESEPYVDHKKLNKSLNKFSQSTKSEIDKAMELAKQRAKDELKQELWLESNPDFYDVLQHANKFAEKAPKLAESILRMPDSFERQKLVYENIKTLGIDKPEQKQPSIQEKIDANRKSPYYQPSGVASAPYNVHAGNFTETGQKEAYKKMQELKSRLRI